MSVARRFTVLTTGEIEPGFDEDQVALDVVDLLNTTPERAITFVHTEQSLVADVDEERALAYQQKLNSIGMRVKIIGSDELAGANDEINSVIPAVIEVSDQASGQVSDQVSDQISDRVSDRVSDQVNLESQIGTHSEKLSEDKILANIREQGKTKEDIQVAKSSSSNRKLTLPLLLLALVSALAVASVYFWNTHQSGTTATTNAQQYSITNNASRAINELVEISGMDVWMTSFNEILIQRFQNEFSKIVNANSRVTKGELMVVVPKAYNDTALRNTVANQLNQTTFEEDVPMFIELFKQPAVQSLIDAKQARNRHLDSEGFLAFQETLEDNPLDGPRQRALYRLLDALILDKVEYELEGDVLRAVISTTGNISINRDEPVAKERVRTELRDMRDALVYARSDIRRNALHELAWQLEESSIEEIHAIRSTLDDSGVRELYRQMVKGYDDFLRKSTQWLRNQL